MRVRNKRPYPVVIEDAASGASYECAARPGVVEVPDVLGKRLLKQEDAWDVAEDDAPKASAKKENDK